MVRIAELSKDVAKDYRETKKTKLQRTFVSGSNAAESKVSSKLSDTKNDIHTINSLFRNQEFRPRITHKLQYGTTITCTYF